MSKNIMPIMRIAGTVISERRLMKTFYHLSYVGKQALIEITEKSENTEQALTKMKRVIEHIQEASKVPQKEGLFKNE